MQSRDNHLAALRQTLNSPNPARNQPQNRWGSVAEWRIVQEEVVMTQMSVPIAVDGLEKLRLDKTTIGKAMYSWFSTVKDEREEADTVAAE